MRKRDPDRQIDRHTYTSTHKRRVDIEIKTETKAERHTDKGKGERERLREREILTNPICGIFFQRISNEDEIFQTRKFTEVIELSPLSDVVVSDVQHLQLGQTPNRLQAINLGPMS